MPKKFKPVTKLEFAPLTQELFEQLRHNGLSCVGGYLSDPADFVHPLIWRHPNPWERRTVRISILQFWGFPHYFAHVVEEENYFVGKGGYRDKGLIWRRPWGKDDDPLYQTLRANEELREQLQGRRFDSGELNTAKAAERFVDKVIKAHFSDKKLFEIYVENGGGTKYEGALYAGKEGD